MNVGAAAPLAWEGRVIRTGIRKRPVTGRVPIREGHLLGDEQADPRVHGGPLKALYAYPSEHYAFWRTELGPAALPWGAFGENLTTEGWLETEVRVGERVRIGTAELVVTQPRGPCVKINAAFGRADMIDRFHRARRTGFYLGVERAGGLAAGDPIELLDRPADGATVYALSGAEDR